MATEYQKKADGSRLYVPGLGLVRDGQTIPAALAVQSHMVDHVELVEVEDPAPVVKPSVPVAKPPAPYVPLGVKPAEIPREALHTEVVSSVDEPEVVVEMVCPIEGYDELNASDSGKAIADLEKWDDVLAIEAYERANKNRVSVLRRIEEEKLEFKD